MKPVFSADIELAQEAAYTAGAAVMEIYDTDFSVDIKQDTSPVTKADITSDEIIKTILAKTGYPIISEEGVQSKIDLSVGMAWVIDPLDGTKDFIGKTGEFTILIGLILDGRPVGGVVFQPVTNTLYVAEKGAGAFRKNNTDWEKITVSADTRNEQTRVVVSRHHFGPYEQNILKELGLGYTQKGSCGLKIAEVAGGYFDLYFAQGPNQWDACAGDAIISEAGGIVSRFDGSPIRYGGLDRKIPYGIIAANSSVWARFVDFYKEYAQK